ncbi:MAG: Arsenite methyltransferase [Nitrospirae bacterium]|nr:Arsenite methyltransferase [Nitrospirota bacterium]
MVTRRPWPAEAFRVLRPGGRLALSDIVVKGAVPSEIRRNLELWAGCVAGALEESEYRELLRQTGFMEVGVEPTRIYHADDVKASLVGTELTSDLLIAQVEGKFMSAFIRAKKPMVAAGSHPAVVQP